MMYYSLKYDCYVRASGDIGYISRPLVGIDKIVDSNGTVFLSKLQYEPLSVDYIVKLLADTFEGVSESELAEDAVSFYDMLLADDFLNVGNCTQAETDSHFDYSTLKGEHAYSDGYIADTSF